MDALAFDPVAEHDKTRAALHETAQRLGQLLDNVGDMTVPSSLPDWTVGDVGAHLRAVYLAYCSAFTGEFADWGSVLPPGDGSLTERITAVNAKAVSLFGADERAHLGDFVRDHGETFLRVTGGLAPETPVPTPWYGQQVTLTLATATGLMLSESLLHGLDIARGARLPWTIGADAARLVVGQSLPTMMPLTLDRAKAQGVRISFDLAVRGGPRLVAAVEDGTMTVTREGTSSRRSDCRISMDPVAFLLIAFRRSPLWKEMAQGRILAGGPRPWLALRLRGLIAGP
ncbi:maleylpyruvate isomerase N-terminal domain-containing protein [Streptomyces sp. NPDC001404]|uniref:maleylpyruvate isomerase N-terminal domain-containing protein n=1 Tax=Streptomyces sp. NPDC001404 TaxID=3364571 RepID=UPI0036B654F9